MLEDHESSKKIVSKLSLEEETALAAKAAATAAVDVAKASQEMLVLQNEGDLSSTNNRMIFFFICLSGFTSTYSLSSEL